MGYQTWTLAARRDPIYRRARVCGARPPWTGPSKTRREQCDTRDAEAYSFPSLNTDEDACAAEAIGRLRRRGDRDFREITGRPGMGARMVAEESSGLWVTTGSLSQQARHITTAAHTARSSSSSSSSSSHSSRTSRGAQPQRGRSVAAAQYAIRHRQSPPFTATASTSSERPPNEHRAVRLKTTTRRSTR